MRSEQTHAITNTIANKQTNRQHHNSALELDGRNFHAWAYRHFLARLAPVVEELLRERIGSVGDLRGEAVD